MLSQVLPDIEKIEIRRVTLVAQDRNKFRRFEKTKENEIDLFSPCAESS